MLKLLRPALRNIFNLDYELIQSFMAICAGLSILSYSAEHWIEKSMGFSEYWPVRIATLLICVPILFFPRKGRLAGWKILYWESSVAFILPGANMFYFFLNR